MLLFVRFLSLGLFAMFVRVSFAIRPFRLLFVPVGCVCVLRLLHVAFLCFVFLGMFIVCRVWLYLCSLFWIVVMFA